jgi:adhesin transport system membrane fusion protein
MSTTQIDTVLKNLGEPHWRAPQRYLLTFLALIILWSLFARVDRVVTAPGKVIPFDRVKVIQHLEGGILQDILVRENDRVTVGQPLVRLDLASTGYNSAEMNARMISLRLAKVRLDAESQGRKPDWPTDLPIQFTNLVDAELSNYRNKQVERESSLRAYDNLILQSRQKLAESKERLNSLEVSLSIARKELDISSELLKDKLTSQLEHFQRQNKVTQLAGEILSLRQTNPGLEAAIEESIARRKQEEARFRRESANEASDVERQIASLSEELSRAQDQVDRSLIRSPIEGVIKNLKYQAEGNVVKPGEAIMEVVPLKDQLVIEVRLNPSDRGYVSLNQDANVKISTYDYLRYGTLPGKVTEIAADTDTGQNQEQYYRVVVSTDKSWLGEQSGQYPISPGMTGEVDIKVSNQAIIWSLLKPILRIKNEAFREI